MDYRADNGILDPAFHLSVFHHHAEQASISDLDSRPKSSRPGISKNGKQLRLMPDGTYEEFPPLLTDVLDAVTVCRRYHP